MSRVCDRCRSLPVVEMFTSKITGTEIDLCKLCTDEFSRWYEYTPPPGESEQPQEDKTRGRHKRTA